MHQGPPLELEDQLARVAVAFVLPTGIIHGLAGQRILQLDRSDGNTVQAEGDVERPLRTRGVVELPGQPQAVRRIACLQLGVELVDTSKNRVFEVI